MIARRSPSRTRKLVGILAIGAVTALALTACAPATSKSSSTTGADTLTMQLDGPVTSYDPALGASFQDVVVVWSMYDTLVALDADGSVVPGLATDWDVTADSAVFTIRDGVTCSDGEE